MNQEKITSLASSWNKTMKDGELCCDEKTVDSQIPRKEDIMNAIAAIYKPGLGRAFALSALLFMFLQPAFAFQALIHDLGNDPANATVLGADADDRVGWRGSLTAGDLNGDGIADLILGAFNADAAGNAKPDAGEAYVFFGSSGLGGTVDLGTATPDIKILGRDAGDRLGLSMTLGDFNGDGEQDLLIGARDADGPVNSRPDAGEVYVFFGPRHTGEALDLATTNPDFTVYGIDPGDNLGDWVAAGDLNGDGIDDLLLGAWHADGPGNTKENAGEVYAIFGSHTLGGSIDLATTSPNLIVFGADGAADPSGDQMGMALAAGDLNGDGIDDLLVSAYRADGPGNTRFDAGEAYVIMGSHSLGGTIDLAVTSPLLTILGADASDNFGSSVAAGDFNGDGIDDLLLGAWLAKSVGDSRWEAGEAYVILGKPALGGTIDLKTVPVDLTIYGSDAGDFLGDAVAAGDVNGDGMEDILVAPTHADGIGNTKNDVGEVDVFYGSPTLGGSIDLSSTAPDLRIVGVDPNDWFGHHMVVSDLNGDGTCDLAVGAPGAASVGNTRYDAGEDYVIFGVPSRTLTILGPAELFLGVTNSDNNGRRIDIKVEIFRNGTDDAHKLAEGVLANQQVAGNALNNSKKFTIGLPQIGNVEFADDDVLSVKVSLRRVGGSGNFGVRFWYNSDSTTSKSRGWSRMEKATIGGLPAHHYYFLAGSLLGTRPNHAGTASVITATTSYQSFSIWSVQGSLMKPGGGITDVPSEYALDQNHPNPFNPSTTISYQIPTQNLVTLKVYDLLGREVATLVDGLEEPGYKWVNFDAGRLASGVYFYRLLAAEYESTQKMLVVK